VDYARRRHTAKRGGGRVDVSIDDATLVADDRVEEVLAVDRALERLAEMDERQARIIEHRYFTGLTIPETADVMEVSEATVKREWAAARAWLYRYISEESE
jgi:RNA polymerase sigma factor (TIGR02999 family)